MFAISFIFDTKTVRVIMTGTINIVVFLASTTIWLNIVWSTLSHSH